MKLPEKDGVIPAKTLRLIKSTYYSTEKERARLENTPDSPSCLNRRERIVELGEKRLCIDKLFAIIDMQDYLYSEDE